MMRRIVLKLIVCHASVAGLVWMLRAALGPWAAALVLAPVFMTGVIVGGYLVDKKLFDDPSPLPVRRRPVLDARVIDR